MRKRCTNQACTMRNTLVTTDRDSCLACGRDLVAPSGNDIIDAFADLVGDISDTIHRP